MGGQSAATSASTETAPLLADAPNYSVGGYIQGLGLMFLLIAGLWFLVRFLKRYGRFNFIPRQDSLPRDSFFMEAQMPVGPRKFLMVVRFMEKRYLLGVTDQQISVLTSAPLDTSSSNQKEPSFEECVRAEQER
ncbi:MAG: flagellar biosynthetic protein FliO [Desulfovibrio sp.]|nr:flagellar biosynthetic protein FliO [Desulfovibrio sp.]